MPLGRELPRRGGRGSKKRLRARAAWEFTLGPKYIDGIRKSGRPIEDADLPPRMKWEGRVWDLFAGRLATQWRSGFGGRTGLDFNVAIALAGRRGWDVDLTLELLGALEAEILDWDDRERPKHSQD